MATKDFTISPITDQGTKKITIQYRDKLSGDYLFKREVTRAFLAKMYHDQRVTHSLNGVPVIDI